MRRIALGVAESLLSHLGGLGLTRRGTRRVTSDSKAGRQMVSKQVARARSKHMPHIGAKEQERAKRCYMNANFSVHTPRSAPTMETYSKRSFYDGAF